MAVHHVKQATFGGAAAAAVDVKYFFFFLVHQRISIKLRFTDAYAFLLLD